MLNSVKNDLNTRGLNAMIFGPISGIPYKIYAVQSGNLKINIIYFILISIPARFIRFLLITIIFHIFARFIFRITKLRITSLIHATIWAAFYIFYFTTMPN